MHTARIAELLEPYLQPQGPKPAADAPRLAAGDLQHISTYIDILLRWNARINLTAIRDEEQIVTRHFGESFFAARRLFPHAARLGMAALEAGPQPALASRTGPAERSSAAAIRKGGHSQGDEREDSRTIWDGALAPEVDGRRPKTVADLGSGAGFPGFPLKLWAPQISLTLIESNHKKAAFLREVARALTLTDINILALRAESLDQKFDLVTLRAVERFEAILPIAARLLAPSGRLALLISSAQVPQAHAILSALSWADPLPIPSSQSRVVLIGDAAVLHHI